MSDTASNLWQRRPWHTEQNVCSDAPWGLLGTGEGHLLYYLARDYYRGDGAIVDAGAFLGRSAWFFARGLEANPHLSTRAAVIHSYDNFLVNEELTTRHIAEHLGETRAVGASTRDLFDRATRPVSQHLQVHAGDFHEMPWTAGPIDILFVDIAKSATLHRHLVEQMFPHLVPGRSLVVQQDYHHAWLPHIHCAMEYLHEHFTLVEPKVDDSAVFLLTSRIPDEALHVAATIDALPFEQRLALMDRALARLPQPARRYVALARALMIGRTLDFPALSDALDALDAEAAASAPDAYWQAARAELNPTFSLGRAWHLLEKGRSADVLEMTAASSSEAERQDAALLAPYTGWIRSHAGRPEFPADAATALSPDDLARRFEPAWRQLRREYDVSPVLEAHAMRALRALMATHFDDRGHDRPAVVPPRLSSIDDLHAALLAFEAFHALAEPEDSQARLRQRTQAIRQVTREPRFHAGICRMLESSTLLRTHAFLLVAPDAEFAATGASLSSETPT